MKTKRYLFNCLKDPRQATRIISGRYRNHIERNPGDLAYEYSVMNALTTDESIEFIPTGYYHFNGFSEAKIEEINATCNAFICPLADVFSDTFLYLLRRITDLVHQLKIPCIVPCVGLRASKGAWSAHKPEFDDTVKKFVRAILEKSARIGVRGETTGQYLEKLGFRREEHFTIVGCPSMYTYGAVLPQRSLLPPKSLERCAFNLNYRADEQDWNFIDGLADQFKESIFVSQNWNVFEQFMLTNGRITNEAVEALPIFKALLQKYATENRMRFFLNRKPWMDFLATRDISFGHRIHGAILAILAGTPAVVIPFESRTEELARFHGIAMISSSSQTCTKDNCSFLMNLNVKSIFNNLDFSLLAKRQQENFENWISFLHVNDLETIFDNKDKEEGGCRDFPLEKALPYKYPDDNIKAWDFNSRIVKMRMAVATNDMFLRRLHGIIVRISNKFHKLELFR